MRVIEVQQALREAAEFWKDTTSPLYNTMTLAADAIDDQAGKIRKLEAELEMRRRGECICVKCGLRQNAETEAGKF